MPKRGDAGPCDLGGWSEELHEGLELLLGQRPLVADFYSEDRSQRQALAKDATRRPAVDGRTVRGGAQQQLRRTVPCRDDRPVEAEGPQWRIVQASQPKVADLQHPRLGIPCSTRRRVEKQIGWLHVSVHDLAAMQVFEPAQQLAHERLAACAARCCLAERSGQTSAKIATSTCSKMRLRPAGFSLSSHPWT